MSAEAEPAFRKSFDGPAPRFNIRRLKWVRALAVGAIPLLASSQVAGAGDDRWNWNYCAPPYPPACVEAAEKPARESAACESDVEAYIAAVFRYRVCLVNETERAVREANRVLQITRCPKDKRYCYNLPRADPAPNGTPIYR